MSRKNKRNIGETQTGNASKLKNIQAWAGFPLAARPFLLEDILSEPTKKELNNTAFDYIPFDTFDLFRLDRLLAIVNNSPTNSSIIDQKVAYCLGDGYHAVPSSHFDVLKSVKETRNALSEIAEDSKETLNDYLKVVNPENEGIEELSDKVFNDFESFGNAFIELVRVKKGSTRKFYMRLLPVTWCRPKKPESHEVYSKFVGVTSEFEEGYRVTPSKALDYPLFPTFLPVTESDEQEGVERSIIHLKNYSSTLLYWGVPDWVSAKIWAELEYRIAKYNQSKFENGFTPSAIISAFGSTNEEEAAKLVGAMKACFTGTGNNSKMFIQALRNESYKTDVQILENHNEGEFLEMQNIARESIISVHRWNASLTGLRTAGSLGSNQQIRSEFDIVYSTVIRPTQRLFLNKFLNPAIQAAGDWLGESWEGLALDILKPMPVTFAGDIVPSTVMSVNEMRKELGLAPLENENLDNGNTD